MPLPLEAAWDEAAFQSVLTLYVRTMITECGSGSLGDEQAQASAPATFIRALLASRFESLPPTQFERLAHPPKPTGPFTCGAPWDVPAVAKALADYVPGPLNPRILADAGPEREFMVPDMAERLPFPRGLRRRIHSRARSACSLLTTASADPVLRALTLEDYFQDLFRHFIGIDRMVPYMQACFTQ